MYNLELSGLGLSTNSYEAALKGRLDALKAQGGITKAEEFLALALISNHNNDKAGELINTKEKELAASPVQWVFGWIPDGYKFHQQLITNVPNWALYVGAGLVGATVYKRFKKRRK